jgi:hypothetical protein
VYDRETLYLVGDAQAPSNNPITQQFNSFFIALVVDPSNDKIIDAGCSSTIQLTNDFVRSILVGQSILSTTEVETQIRTRYFGSSQKALVVAFKDAQKKYKLAKEAREKLSMTEST